jgi:hypothetical protein
MKLQKSIEKVGELHGSEVAREVVTLLPQAAEVATTSIDKWGRFTVAPVIMDLLSVFLLDMEEETTKGDDVIRKATKMFGDEVALEAITTAIKVGQDVETWLVEKRAVRFMLQVVGLLAIAIFDYFMLRTEVNVVGLSKADFLEWLDKSLTE